MDVSLIIYTVDDVTKAKQFFGKLLGADPYVDSPMYTGFKNGGVEIGLVATGGKVPQSTLPYWNVDDIAASVKSLVDAGGTIAQDVRDVGYGMLVASVKDANGAAVGLRQPPKG